jgi:hypothetical protein
MLKICALLCSIYILHTYVLMEVWLELHFQKDDPTKSDLPKGQVQNFQFTCCKATLNAVISYSVEIMGATCCGICAHGGQKDTADSFVKVTIDVELVLSRQC